MSAAATKPARLGWRTAWMFAGLLAAVGTVVAQGEKSAAPRRELPAPSWWAGRSPDLETALKAAGNWCRSVENPHKFGVARAWVLADGSWAIGAGVGPNPDKGRDRRELQDTLRTKATDRALRCLAVASLGDDALGSLAVEGANYRFEASAIEAELSRGPRTKAYVEGGRAYTIALLARDDVQSMKLKGIEELGLGGLAAQGLLRHAAANPAGVRAIVESALAMDSSPATVVVAAKRCLRDKNPAAAALAFKAARTMITNIGDGAVQRWAALATLANTDAGLAGVLEKAGNETSRADAMARHLRAEGMTDLPMLIHADSGPAVLLVLSKPAQDDRSVRRAFQRLRSETGGVRLPRLAVALDGSLVKAVFPDEAPFRSGAQVRMPGAKPDWLLLQVAEKLDPRLAPSGPRVRLAGLGRVGVEEIARRAAISRAVSLGLWTGMSNGTIASAAASGAARTAALWTIDLGEGAWEVEFTPAIDKVLRAGGKRVPFTACAVVGPGTAALRGVLDRAVAACGGSVAAEKQADVVVRLTLERGKLERGEDKGSLLIGSKPWVRVPVKVHLDVTAGKVSKRLSRPGRSRKVFGGHDTSPFVTTAATELLKRAGEGLPQTIAVLLDARARVRVTGPDSDIMTSVLTAARNFGTVVPVKAPEETPVKAADKPPADPCFDLSWPGGEAGLRRALHALRGLPAWAAVSALRVQSADQNHTHPGK